MLLDEIERSQEESWNTTTSSARDLNNSLRFAHENVNLKIKKSGAAAPAWYENPGPWWLPSAAAKAKDVGWAKKYTNFVNNSKPGILPV